MHTHTIETNVSVALVLLGTALCFIITGHMESVIQPLGVLAGWFVSEIVNRYREDK